MTGRGVRAWLLKYLPLVVGVPGCLAAGWFELTRALAGREIAWVYVGEWPLYAVAGTYLWWRVWHPSAQQPGRRHPAGPTEGAGAVGDPDPGLVAWQGYLDRLHAADPPGGPPER